MRSPTVMGLDVPGPGSLVFQTMFFVDDHSTGRPVSSLMPCPSGPRKRDQSAPVAEQIPKTRSNRHAKWREARMINPPLTLSFPSSAWERTVAKLCFASDTSREAEL